MSEQEVFDQLKYRIEVDKDGTHRYYNSAWQYHRENGPAVEYANGDKEWYQNGQRHRTDGPAIEWTDGTKFWYQNGKLHREDGPAMVYPNGVWSWYLNGVRYTEDNFRLALESRRKIMLQQRVPS